MIIAKKATIQPNRITARASAVTPIGSGSSPAISVDSALSTTSRNPVQNRVITAAVNDLSGRVASVESQALSGAPTPVATVAEMTDTTKVYLYVGSETGFTAGDWYYYDGSEWASGGTYGEGGINTNARNLLKYVLERVAYTETGMQTYVDALIEALKAGSGGGDVGTYSVIYALTNVTSDNDTTAVNDGASYTCTLTAATGYTIDTVTVTMGGEDITATAYSNGVVSIASVTGDVVITANALDYPVIKWDYTLGRLPSTADGIATTENGMTASFVSGEGIYVNNLSANNTQYVRYQPENYATARKTVFEATVIIVSANNSAGVQSRLSNGTNGANIAIWNYENGFKLASNEGSANTSLVYISNLIFNREYKLKVEYESGVSTKVYLDDVLVRTTDQFSTYYTTANRFYIQGGQQTYVKSMKWSILEV